MTDDCIACDLAAGRTPLPGGLILRRRHWRVEHCVGPLGVGSLIVKPDRHVTAVGDLTDGEAADLGPLLRDVSRVVQELTHAEQVYNCLWSHAGGVPVHIHYVVQPVTRALLQAHGSYGPSLQLAMFAADVTPDPAEVERFAAAARDRFGSVQPERSG